MGLVVHAAPLLKEGPLGILIIKMVIIIISPIFSVKNPIKYNILRKRLDILINKLIKAKLYKTFPIKIIGVDGEDYHKKLDSLLYKDHWDNQYFKFLDGTKGCALSHVLALKYIQKNQIKDNVLIIEDDVNISENFIQLIPDKFPENYDILIMSNDFQQNYNSQQKTEIENVKKIVNPPKEGVFTLETYFVNGININNIIENILPLKYQIDKVLPVCDKLNNYILDPRLKASSQNKEIDSYRIMLNKNKFKYFMEFVDCDFLPKQIPSQIIFYKILVHTTMLESDTENNAASCITFSLSTEKQTFNAYDFIEIEWPDSRSTEDYKEIVVKILKYKLSKKCQNNINIFKFTVNYFNKYYVNQSMNISNLFHLYK